MMGSSIGGSWWWNRKQWIDVLGNHVQLPITIVDQRKNKFNNYYRIMVVRKGEVLYQNVGNRNQIECRRLRRKVHMFLNLIFMKLGTWMWRWSLKTSIDKLWMSMSISTRISKRWIIWNGSSLFQWLSFQLFCFAHRIWVLHYLFSLYRILVVNPCVCWKNSRNRAFFPVFLFLKSCIVEC